MQSLNLRQVIILAVMCIVILYGAFVWLAPKSSNHKEKGNASQEDIRSFIGGLTSGVGRTDDSVKIAYTVAMAEKPWSQDPFLGKIQYAALMKAKDAVAASEKEGKTNFVYTGFVEIKGKQMAIINGEEYALGEKLLTNRHVLKMIDPAKVIIMDLSLMQEMTVPFQD